MFVDSNENRIRSQSLFSQSLFVIALVWVLNGCRDPVWLFNEYKVQSRKSQVLKQSYHIDSLYTPIVILCLNSSDVASKFKSNGAIIYDDREVAKDLNESYRIYFDQMVSGVLYIKENCDYPLTSLSLSGLKNELDLTTEESTLVPVCNITTQSGKRIYGGGGLEIPEDSGLDLHWVKYELHTSIFRNDSLIYWDNRFYWDSIMSERDEIVHYDIPISILDSLVELTTLEYKKRLVD